MIVQISLFLQSFVHYLVGLGSFLHLECQFSLSSFRLKVVAENLMVVFESRLLFLCHPFLFNQPSLLARVLTTFPFLRFSSIVRRHLEVTFILAHLHLDSYSDCFLVNVWPLLRLFESLIVRSRSISVCHVMYMHIA